MVEYNKVYKKRDGRKLVAGGPRDIQIKQRIINSTASVSSNELEQLRHDVDALSSNTNRSMPVDDDLASKIDEAIEEISVELERRYLDKISGLEATINEKNKYIKRLEIKLDKQDEIIYNFTNKINTAPVYTGQFDPVDDENKITRPGIANIVIDATEKGSEDKFESHIKTKEIKSSKPLSNNVNKLKNLMGSKLPKN